MAEAHIDLKIPGLDALAADLKRLTDALDTNDTTTAAIAVRAIQLMREAGDERDQANTELGNALDHIDRITIAFNEAIAIFDGAPEYADAVARWQTALNQADPAEQGAPVDWPAIVRQREQELKQQGAARHEAEQQRDGAYRERAQLVALLAALHPAVIAAAPDVNEPGWQIAYLTIGGRQATWHIHPRDADLFAHVEHVDAAFDPRAGWDGHTTAEKYQRIADHIAHRDFTPPIHYQRSDGVETCVHRIPIGPDSCWDCRDLAQDAAPRGGNRT